MIIGIIAGVILLVIICSVLFGHKHEFGSWTVTSESTCTFEGTEVRYCSGCDEFETRSIPANGHTPVTDAAVPATCTQSGKTEGSHCSVCSSIIKAQETVSAKGHSISNGYCSSCGYVSDAVAALVHYIRTNGKYSSSSGDYYLDKLTYKDEYTYYFSINVTTSGEVEFNVLTQSSSMDVFVQLDYVKGASTQDTSILVTYGSTKVYGSGYIYTGTFNSDTGYVYGFQCNYSSVSSSTKNLLTSQTSLLLAGVGLILAESDLDIDLYDLGFKGY